jgi:putative transcriptional regulator
MTRKPKTMTKVKTRMAALGVKVPKRSVQPRASVSSSAAVPASKAAVHPRDRVSADLLDTAQDIAALGILTKPALARIKTLTLDVPPTYTSEHVSRKARMSQAVFARMLNVSVSTVQKWEAPAAHKHPSGAAAKLLQVIERKGIEAVV